MGLFGFGKKETKTNWVDLTEMSQLDKIKEESNEIPALIFKHSTRCSISLMAKNRLDSHWSLPEDQMKIYYLDLLNHRDISNQIAQDFNVFHESPQVLLIKNGKCIYSATHSAINERDIEKQIK